jgi:hypothetical protein
MSVKFIEGMGLPPARECDRTDVAVSAIVCAGHAARLSGQRW